jgi:hypothetical protein
MTSNGNVSNMIRLLALLTCAVWLGFVAWSSYAGWPALPLDVNASDPAVERLYRHAMRAYALNTLLLGVAPLLFVYATSKLVRRLA